MRNNRKGYTLIELVVVVLIIGILASFGIPQYLKTVETSKADDAVTTINMIGTVNKMFALDHNGAYAYGAFTAACAATSTCAAMTPPYSNPCALVYCKYLADQDWASRPYEYAACNGAAAGACSTASFSVGAGLQVSAAHRKGSASNPYNTWGYAMATTGVITAYGTTPAPPSY